MKTLKTGYMMALTALFCAVTALAVDYSWTGEGGDTDWRTWQNWDPDTGSPASGDTATFEVNANVQFPGADITLAALTAGAVAGTTQKLIGDPSWGPAILNVNGPVSLCTASGTQFEIAQGSFQFNQGFTAFAGDGFNRTFIINDWVWFGHGNTSWTLHDNNSAGYYNNRLALRGFGGFNLPNLTIGSTTQTGATTNYFEIAPGRVDVNNTLTLRGKGTVLDICGWSWDNKVGHLRIDQNFTCVADSSGGLPTVRIVMPSTGYLNWNNEYPAFIIMWNLLPFNSGVYPDVVVDATAFTDDGYVPLLAVRNAATGTELADRWADKYLTPNVVRLVTLDQSHGGNNYRTLHALVKGQNTAWTWVNINFDWQDDPTTPTVTQEECVVGDPFYSLPVPTFAGAVFKGWRTAPNGGGNLVSAADLAPNSTVTYYASWDSPNFDSTWVGNQGDTPSDSDWFVPSNWSTGQIPEDITFVTVSNPDAVINVTNNATMNRLTFSPVGAGTGMVLNIASGATFRTLNLAPQGQETPTLVANIDFNSTPVTVNVEGAFICDGGNTQFGRGHDSNITFKGGGTVHWGWQGWFGNGTYWGSFGPNASAVMENITISHGWSAFYGHCAITNCTIVGVAILRFAERPNAVSRLHSTIVTNRGNGGAYATITGSTVIITGGSQIRNESNPVRYARQDNASVTLADSSVMTDVSRVTMFDGDDNITSATHGARFIVDNSAYTNTSVGVDTLQIGGATNAFYDNRIIVRNGGEFNFAAEMNFGATVDVEIPNGIEVDNSSFIGNALNLRNNVELDITGAEAVVRLNKLTCSDTSQDYAPTVNITIPEEGFAAAPIIIADTLGGGMSLAINAEAFSKKVTGYGTTPLIAVAGTVEDLNSTDFWRDITVSPAWLEKGLVTKTAEVDEVTYTVLSLKVARPTLILVK